MSLVTFSELLGQTCPDGTYVIDTSFALGATAGASREQQDKRYKRANDLRRHLLKHGVGLVHTGLIRGEAAHKLREALFAKAMETNLKKYAKITKIYKDSKNDLKEMLKAGYVKAFEEALGKDGKILQKELDSVFFGSKYLATEEMKPKPSWTHAREIMATYGLDSTDAMILNFAISQKTFRGLITMDGDFRFCNDVPAFDIVVPDSVLNLDGFKELE
jgi:hypothetical protein